ncbi:MAG: cobyrinate a,c-diamide synthase [Pseudomonadota bacterium]
MDKATTAPTHPPVGGGLVISAPSSGQGKTSMTLGLLRAYKRSGVSVSSAKSGPDYIDPAFHAAATGRPCWTLDGWAMSDATLQMRTRNGRAELLVVEGAMGLFDGPVGADSASTMVRGSTAQVAHVLGLPVLLVLDARRMGQSAGAVIAGLARWTDEFKIAGVILNRVASVRHEAMVRPAVEHICPVYGVLPEDRRLALPSRHLGLVQASEMPELETFLDGAATVVSEHVDLDEVRDVARPANSAQGGVSLSPIGQRIAVARDVAFAFIYPHLVEDWRSAGAEISFFSPLADEAPDSDCDAVFLPGGYPELHAGLLAQNTRFMSGLAQAASRGALIYGECGGFMVLGDGLVDSDGVRHAMAGLLRLETSFADRSRHLGYRLLEPLAGPWTHPLAAHEFHYSTILRAEGDPLFRAKDSAGVALPKIGLVRGNVMGSYAHIIAPAPTPAF